MFDRPKPTVGCSASGRRRILCGILNFRRADVEAPVSRSMILAGVLLKLGGYGLLRVFPLLFQFGFGFCVVWVPLNLVGVRVTDARRFEARCHFHFEPKKIPRIRHLDPFTLKAVLFHRQFGNVQHSDSTQIPRSPASLRYKATAAASLQNPDVYFVCQTF